MHRAIAYARVSTNTQAETQSIAQQVAALEKYAQEHHLDLCVPEDYPGWVYCDDGVSGDDMERAVALVELMKDFEGLAQALIVTKLDRLARSLFLQLFIEEEAKKLGIKVVCLDQPGMDDQDPWQVFLRQQMGGIAELEKKLIVRRLMAGKRHRALQGRKTNGNAPYGYKYTQTRPKAIQIIPEEAEVVRRIFALAIQAEPDLEGHLFSPISLICWRLNREGARRRGKPWNYDQVRILLMNPFYCGYLKYKDQWVKGAHPAIIAPEDFDKAQVVVIRNSKRLRKKGKRPLKYRTTF